MFELTDTLTYAVPVMLAVLVAKTVADALEPKGIYDLVIECVSFEGKPTDLLKPFPGYLSCLTSTPSTSISGVTLKYKTW
jgi:hypothetical protein